MRIWGITPGYLNDKSLLDEHRELHGIASILVNNKKGYAKHPETMGRCGRIIQRLQPKHFSGDMLWKLANFCDKARS